MDQSDPATRHAVAAIVAPVGPVGSPARSVARSVPPAPGFHRARRHALAGSLRLPAAILSGPVLDGPAARVAPRLREPEAPPDSTRAERKAGFPGQPGGRCSARD